VLVRRRIAQRMVPLIGPDAWAVDDVSLPNPVGCDRPAGVVTLVTAAHAFLTEQRLAPKARTPASLFATSSW
jgi:hypothetical protein